MERAKYQRLMEVPVYRETPTFHVSKVITLIQRRVAESSVSPLDVICWSAQAHPQPSSPFGGSPTCLRSFAGRIRGRLLRGVAMDFAIRQRLLQFINLRLGEVGIIFKIQLL